MPTAMESVFTGSITIDGERVTVRRTAGGEVWLTQLEIARLFGVFEAAVRANIRAIYRSEALRRGRTLRIVHGVELYSLEMIAALTWLSCENNPGDGVSTFPVPAWFDNDTKPDNLEIYQGQWTYDGKTITIDFRKVE